MGFQPVFPSPLTNGYRQPDITNIEIKKSSTGYMFLLPLPEAISSGSRHMPAGIENNQLIVLQMLLQPVHTDQGIG